jgi:hypothetical protein
MVPILVRFCFKIQYWVRFEFGFSIFKIVRLYNFYKLARRYLLLVPIYDGACLPRSPLFFSFGMSNFDWPITKKELIKKKKALEASQNRSSYVKCSATPLAQVYR